MANVWGAYQILLGFATLMFGMETMSGAVKGLKDVPEFQQLFLLFRNPILGVLAGAVLGIIDGFLAVLLVKKIGEYINNRKLSK